MRTLSISTRERGTAPFSSHLLGDDRVGKWRRGEIAKVPIEVSVHNSDNNWNPEGFVENISCNKTLLDVEKDKDY